MLRADLLDAFDPRWPDTLAQTRHDFYHLPEYVDFCATHTEPGEPVAFLAEDEGDRLLLPLIVRRIPARGDTAGGDLDATSTRGYSGPVASFMAEPGDAGFLDRAIQGFQELLRSAGIVSAFVRLHPLLTPATEVLEQYGTVVNHGDSVAVDLAASETEMWRMTRHNHRRDISKARRLGHTVRIDERWERLDDLVLAYSQSMARLGATETWQLPRQYFADLREALGDHAHLCVVEDGDRLCAAAVLTEVDGIVEYHLAGTMDEYVSTSPSKSIIDFARRWARDRDDRVLHLAGSVDRGDPLIRFKLGFSPVQHPVLSWRVIADDARYQELTQAWSDRSGSAPDRPSGFFPAYRKPIPSADEKVAHDAEDRDR